MPLRSLTVASRNGHRNARAEAVQGSSIFAETFHYHRARRDLSGSQKGTNMAEPMLSSLVNAAAPENRPATEPNRVGVFTSPQSLTTFSGASAAVNVIWRVLGNTFPAWGGEKVTLLVIALLVGALVF